MPMTANKVKIKIEFLREEATRRTWGDRHEPSLVTTQLFLPKRTAWKRTHPKGGKQTDGAGSTVLGKGARDDLQGLSNGPIRPLFHTSHGFGFFCQGMSHSHLRSPAPWHQLRVQKNIAAHLHGILEVAFYFLGKANRQYKAKVRWLRNKPEASKDFLIAKFGKPPKRAD